ncbi:MAG TPA: hypothetical protein VFH78_03030 [Candidatus Thermoplasmatota archaeon]|nr:hypothetical protein [Candidatus Thermoplasmatota archaeon]
MPVLARSRSRRHASWSLRLLAGLAGGLAGGLLFGVLMSAFAIGGDPFFGQTGILTLVSSLLGLEPGGLYLVQVWALHAVFSVLFGALFALLVPPRIGRGKSLLLGLAWGFALWLFGAFLLLRALTGAPLMFDAAAVANMVGHLLFGLGLGLVYPQFFVEEERLRDESTGFKPVRPA